MPREIQKPEERTKTIEINRVIEKPAEKQNPFLVSKVSENPRKDLAAISPSQSQADIKKALEKTMDAAKTESFLKTFGSS